MRTFKCWIEKRVMMALFNEAALGRQIVTYRRRTNSLSSDASTEYEIILNLVREARAVIRNPSNPWKQQLFTALKATRAIRNFRFTWAMPLTQFEVAAPRLTRTRPQPTFSF